jgi:hypothetical protein
MTRSIRVPAAVAFAAVLAPFAACGDDTTGPAPATLAFTIQPANDTVGSALALVAVTARDAQGGIVPGFTGAVTVALASNPGNAVLSGTLTVNAAGGVATFSDLAVSKAEEAYTLSVTAGTLTATSAPFDIAEVTLRYSMRYESDGLDLDAGAKVDCSITCPAAQDFTVAYNSNTPIHSRVFHRSSRTIAHLAGRTFSGVHLADTAGVTFSATLIDQPFDNTRTIVLRTDAGNIYKLGNPVEFGTSGADSVRFNVARLN